ncbi:hypothetical protein ACGFI3_46210 [Nonomuraea wenchangensis]|uniref:hypothetical protein n=1 Tax=Nonomuraea wenchangensis TaxID=568860 RepID=UPI003710B612
MTSTKTTAKTAKAAQADWSLTPRGPVQATVQGALALAVLGVGSELASVSPMWAAVAGVGGVGTTILTATRHNLSPAALFYRMGCWLGAAGWLAYTSATTVFSEYAVGSLAVGALVAGLASPLGKPTKDRRLRSATAPARASTALLSRQAVQVAGDWEARIMRVCRMRVQVTAVVPWPTRAGYDVHLVLPGGGVTRQQLANYAEALATDARLAMGCGIEVAPGADRGLVVLRVSTVNRMAMPIDCPDDFTPLSILGALGLGEHPNSDPTEISIRQEATLIAGKRGSGKTTLLQVLSIALGRSTDNLTWHIDLNGGGVTQMWIDVWLDGKVERCPIDWAAADIDEAILMLTVAVAIAKYRKTAYRKLKRKHNTTLLPVSASLPQITIVVDEGAEPFKDPRLAKLLGELQNIGREPAVNLVVSALRPTSDLVPVNMRKQSGVRILMHGPDDDEIGHMFGQWGQGLTMDALGGPGTGLISIGGSRARPFRGFNVSPELVERAAIAIARMRPDLDQASADVAGYWYATRYERMRATFTAMAELEEETQEDTAPAASAPAAQAGGAVPAARRPYEPTPHPAHVPPAVPPVMPAGGETGGAPHLQLVPGGNAADWPDLMAPPAERAAPALPANATDWPDLMGVPSTSPTPAGPAGTGSPNVPAIRHAPGPAPARLVEDGHPLPPFVEAVLEVFQQARRERVHSETLARDLHVVDGQGQPNTNALADLLRPLGVTPLKRAFSVNGEEARGYALDDVLAAANAIRAGRLQVPPEVADWSAA